MGSLSRLTAYVLVDLATLALSAASVSHTLDNQKGFHKRVSDGFLHYACKTGSSEVQVKSRIRREQDRKALDDRARVKGLSKPSHA